KQHKQRMVDRIVDIVGSVRKKRLAIWGLAFKAGTDDTRESAAVYIIEALRKAGAKIQVVDPIVKADKWLSSTKGMKWCDACEASLKDADALIIVTEWELFKTINWKNFPITIPIIDFRNLYSPEAMAQLGIAYYSLGRPSSASKRFHNITPQLTHED
ncbi:MAG TPA: UDP-glucose/GDP-mannose dehydrogenase family protein, partial [Gammaproteobacteria bacterium]|nr:UDP-glucose/GDP-mannose dehydrogenase family protein [Gammaproteobacteria bacterium]